MNKKISLRFDKFNNKKDPIPNCVPEKLFNFLYLYDQSSPLPWHIYEQLPVWYSQLTNFLDEQSLEYNIKDSKDPIKDNENCFYIIQPTGYVSRYLGLENDFKSFVDYMSNISISHLRKGKFKLIIDYSMEGFADQRFDYLHEILLEKDIPSQNVYYLTSNLIAKSYYTDWARKEQIEPLNIICYPYFETRAIEIYEKIKNDSEKICQYDYITQNYRDYYFLCYNRRPHTHRHALMCMLYKENLIDQNLISWPPLHQRSSGEEFSWKPLPYLIKDPILLYELTLSSLELQKISPLTVDENDFSENWAIGFDRSKPYMSTYFSVVTETLFQDNEAVFLSEKIWKPIVNYHPFILVGNAGSLKEIRQLGYKTFSPFINEDYDLIEDPEKRLIEITKEIKRLCNMSKDEIHKWYFDLLPILKYNQEHFFNRKSKIKTNLKEIFGEINES